VAHLEGLLNGLDLGREVLLLERDLDRTLDPPLPAAMGQRTTRPFETWLSRQECPNERGGLPLCGAASAIFNDEAIVRTHAQHCEDCGMFRPLVDACLSYVASASNVLTTPRRLIVCIHDPRALHLENPLRT
jgi:hypothetical protein